LLLGLIGVTVFAFSIPMTRLAGGSVADPQLPPLFVAFGRAAFAGVLSVLYLLAVRPWHRGALPTRSDLPGLMLTSLGIVVGWPVFLGLAVREVEANHAAVITGVLPLVTAMFAAWRFHQRPSPAFWSAAILGCALVISFALLREWQQTGTVRLVLADGMLLAAVVATSGGYVSGARLSARLPPAEVICWVLVLSLPFTVPITWALWPTAPVRWSAWGGFAYLSVFSMWLGFFAWYRALAGGHAVRVSQVQLVQPFLSLLFCVPLLGESIDALTVVFALAIIATVAWSRKQPVRAA
jgi:drug/metabolite transporter (DMT)-like permease